MVQMLLAEKGCPTTKFNGQADPSRWLQSARSIRRPVTAAPNIANATSAPGLAVDLARWHEE